MSKRGPIAADPTIMTVDIGGSKFMPGFADARGNILATERHEWTDRTPEGIVEQVVREMRRMCDEHPDLAARAVAGGITIPAFADPVRGIWVDSDYLDVRDLPICDLLSERLGVPFYGDNDCNACVLAESFFGGAKGARDFLYMTVSSGVGGGVFLDGELYYGARYQSGEIGLTISEVGGRPSLSGNQLGPLEMYGCSVGMARTYAELGGPCEVGGHPVGGMEIADAARAGDAAALRTVELEGRYLGRAIANAACLCAPECVVVGGGISLLFDLYEQPLLAQLERLDEGLRPDVRPSVLGYEGAFLAAAACGLRGSQDFERALGAGGDEACVLEVGLERMPYAVHVTSRLVVDGVVRARGDAPGLGGYLVASGIEDAGRTLDEMMSGADLAAALEGDEGALNRAVEAAEALGRALAFSCMLLDPGTIRLTGELAQARGLLEEPVLEVIQRETYWEQGKVPYLIAWDAEAQLV